MSIPSWDILITSIPHRHERLCGLLAELGRQIMIVPPVYWLAGVTVRLYRDNLQTPYGDKTRALLESSRAEYVSCIDDDDWVAPDYAIRIRAALESRPDYVGYPVLWTRDGVPQMRVEHSVRYHGWTGQDGMLVRDLSEKNPVRRELALQGPWSGGYEADARWAEGMRATGLVKTEVWIPDPLYYYRESTADTFKTGRQPLPGPLPQLPDYPWLVTL